MADIDKVNNKFQARWRDPDGRQRARLFPTRREAEDHLAQVRTEIRRGAYTGDRAGAVTVKEYAASWLPRLRHLRPNSLAVYEVALRLHILPAFGSRKIGSLKVTDVDYFIAALSRKMSPATVRSVNAVFHQMLKAAVREGRLASNPAVGVKLPPRQVRPMTLLTPAEVTAIADSITPGLEVAVWLGAGAGLRMSEALGLTTGRVNFLKRRIHVVEQLQRGHLVEPKTAASRRVIPVDSMIVDKIAAHMERVVPPDHPLLITSAGRPVSRSNFGDHWRAAVRAAGLAPVNFHSLRHFYISALIASGLDVKEVQTRAGHSSATVTLDIYGHLFQHGEDRGRGAIEAMFAGGTGQIGQQEAR